MAIDLPHEFDGEEGEEELPNPEELVDQARDLRTSAESLASNIADLQRAQLAYTASISALADTLSQPAALACGIPHSIKQVLSDIEASTSQSTQLLSDAQDGPLRKLRSGKLKQFSTDSDAFKTATQNHTAAQAKLSSLVGKGKPSKPKLQQLQMGEDETRKRAEQTAVAARAAGKAAEAEHRVTLQKVVRDTAFSQLALHARGLELFTKMMSELAQMPNAEA
ncbi:hypothetical protein AB1Y20_005563 [Prymnesium parvum]|uniref:Uncharacterized protein n=1 Tax=Prymnesium parvum TaxID=97485 RepID=A0AB34J6X3_PRYPA